MNPLKRVLLRIGVCDGILEERESFNAADIVKLKQCLFLVAVMHSFEIRQLISAPFEEIRSSIYK
jgi:hypothetical protein